MAPVSHSDRPAHGPGGQGGELSAMLARRRALELATELLVTARAADDSERRQRARKAISEAYENAASGSRLAMNVVNVLMVARQRLREAGG